jgi:hypothetical protein
VKSVTPSPHPVLETLQTERELLARLLGLYEEERQLYARVLELSRQQGETVSRGGSLASVRRLLETKNECLDLIARLEMTEHRAKVAWENGRQGWSTAGRRRMHETIQEVARVIEEILICEEKNDLILIEQTRVV